MSDTYPTVDGDVVLHVRPVTIVPEADEFLVGDAERRMYVMLPEVALTVIDLFRAGRTVGEVARDTASKGIDVDVADFAARLVELGFASVAPRDGATPVEDGSASSPRRVQAHHVKFLFSRTAWSVYVACAIAASALVITQPELRPAVSDVFFLGTPARSIAAVTLLTFAVAAAHEAFHWLAARAVGVTGAFAVSRRLYFLTFETDLTELWGVPRQRRYGPLLAGLALEATLLCWTLLGRVTAAEGWWEADAWVLDLLAAVDFVLVTGMVAQFCIFVRTDLYAVLITATGCINLWRVNHLLVRRRLGRLDEDGRRELGDAHPRDLAVARWYIWLYLAGTAVAGWYFVAFFVPATVRTVSWAAVAVTSADASSTAFWEALVFGAVVLSPSAITAWATGRDVLGRRA